MKVSAPAPAEPTVVEASRRPRVAHVVLSLQPGGLERIVSDLVRHAMAKGADVLVCCLDEPGALAAELERAGGRVHVVKRRPGSDLGLVRRLADFFRREGVTAVHTHSLDPMFYAGLGARLAGIRCVVHTQHDIMLRTYSRALRLKFRLAVPCFSSLVGVSEETSATLREAGVPQARCLTILNGVDIDRFKRDRADVDRSLPGQWPDDPQEIVIGTVARLSPEKGLDRLISAFERLVAVHPRARLVIVGDGPERARLEEGARAARVPAGSVRFLGRQERVEQFLPRFDVFALSSLTEGIPVAMLEAMAASRAVVATRVGGVPEVVLDGESGVLVPADDPDRLAEEIGRLVQDQVRRARLGAAALARVSDRFGLNAMAESYAAVYALGGETLLRRAIKRNVLDRMPTRLLAWRGSGRRAEVALTFDDGPDPAYTPRILAILRRYGVRATFFLVGERAEREPDLVRRIVADGHEIANHSWTHPDIDQIGWRAALDEIGRTRRDLARATGQACRLFRPPKGKLCLGSTVGAWLSRSTVVMWNVDLKDFQASSAGEILSPLRWRPLVAGDVVLYHGHNEAAIAALPAIIEHAMGRRLDCVLVSRLLGVAS